MELEDLKGAWAQYDKKLSENLKLNEELLRRMNLDNSKREMQKPLIYEMTGIVGLLFFIVFVVAASVRYIYEFKYCIPGFLSAAVALVYFIFAIIKVNKFLSIDYYGGSIIKLQKDIASLNKLVLRLRKIESILLPFFILPLLPLIAKAIYNIDMYSNIKLFSIEIILILGIVFPLTFWTNKHLYDKQFKNTERLLSELDKFEKEE